MTPYGRTNARVPALPEARAVPGLLLTRRAELDALCRDRANRHRHPRSAFRIDPTLTPNRAYDVLQTDQLQVAPLRIAVAVGVATDGAGPLAIDDTRPAPAAPTIESVEERQQEAEAEATVPELRPREDLPQLVIPELRMTPVQSRFQLAGSPTQSRFVASASASPATRSTSCVAYGSKLTWSRPSTGCAILSSPLAGPSTG